MQNAMRHWSSDKWFLNGFGPLIWPSFRKDHCSSSDLSWTISGRLCFQSKEIPTAPGTYPRHPQTLNIPQVPQNIKCGMSGVCSRDLLEFPYIDSMVFDLKVRSFLRWLLRLSGCCWLKLGIKTISALKHPDISSNDNRGMMYIQDVYIYIYISTNPGWNMCLEILAVSILSATLRV